MDDNVHETPVEAYYRVEKENTKLKEEIEKLKNQEKKTMYLLSIYDKKAENYATPFVMPNLAVATREFAAGCQNPQSIMAKYPEDIELRCLGTFDERTGIIKPQTIITITAAKEFVKNGKGNDKPNNPDNN